MDELINVNYIADLNSTGRKDKPLTFSGNAGDNIFIGGSPKRCETHFEVLCGLRRPDVGEIKICGQNPYDMNAKEAAAFRRDHIGAVPQDLGLIPELRMIDQIALPMKSAGADDEQIFAAVRRLTSERLPLHDLYNHPGKCSIRKQTHAALLRAVIGQPGLIVLEGCFDELPDADGEMLWHIFQEIRPQNSVLIYLSGAPTPEQLNWTQRHRI